MLGGILQESAEKYPSKGLRRRGISAWRINDQDEGL
jgi:hypothetical protein